MKKNDIIKLKITDIGVNGEGIGRYENMAFFVKNAIAGDFVEAIITKLNKGFGFAKTLNIIEPSKYRVPFRCPEANRCGGCQLQAISYEAQLEFKRKKVEADLKHIGGFSVQALHEEDLHIASEPESNAGPAVTVQPVLGMDNPYMYRNKAQYPLGLSKDGRIVAGFYAGRTHSIIETPDCCLGPSGSTGILNSVISWMEENSIRPYDEISGKGIVRHVLIRKSKAERFMVCLVVNAKKLPAEEKLIEKLSENDAIETISYNIQTSKGNAILGEKVVPLYNKFNKASETETGHAKNPTAANRKIYPDCIDLSPNITDSISDLNFSISPLSFFQVNPIQTEKLYNIVLDFAALKGDETVWDLYCGIGTISLFLARKAGHVYGVEVVPEAIKDAKHNAALNNIKNVDFFCGKAEDIVPELIKNQDFPEKSMPAPDDVSNNNVSYQGLETSLKNKKNIIVVDPPRKGCDKALLDAIFEIAPEKIIYVSCNPSTLARDLKILCEKDYEIKQVQPVDMFPQTVHVECVVLLSRL